MSLQIKDLGLRSLRLSLDRMDDTAEATWGYIDDNGNEAKLVATQEEVLQELRIRGEKP